MKKKVLGIALIVIIFLISLGTVIYVFNELKNENEIQNIDVTDAKKFKSEYEELNNTEVKEGLNYRSLEISENNPIKYITASDLVSKMDNKESFVVYFGYNSCPYSRLVIESLLKSASLNNVTTIYYVDIKNIRDTYELDEENKPIRTTQGTDGYYQLLAKFDSVLPDYEPIEYKTTKVVKGKKKEVTAKAIIDEKRINSPSFVLVKNGKPVLLTNAIAESVDDPYKELTEEEVNYSLNEFNKLFAQITPSTTTGEICTGQGNC